MPTTHNIKIVDSAMARINTMAHQFARMLKGKRKVESELALLLAYCNVADGVQAMPAATRNQRVSMIVSRASTALCEIIEEVASISDEQFQVIAPTCHE